MKNETIKQRGEEAGLKEPMLQIFTEFFQQRFPEESEFITSYVDEWAGRFSNGNHLTYMDTESRLIYNDIYMDIMRLG